MKDDWEPRGDDSFPPDDGRLAKELESLYQRVASLDAPEGKAAGDVDPDPYCKILQIDPDASLAEIQESFERMNEAWDPDRYPNVDSWKEKAEEKRNQIKDAYEKLLVLHLRRDGVQRVDAPDTSFPASPPPAPLPEDIAVKEAEAPISKVSEGRIGLTARSFPWRIALAVLVLAIGVLVFFWPGIYHYEWIKLGSKDYPLRINRLTAQADYYDGRQWREPPLMRLEIKSNELPQPQALPQPVAQTSATGLPPQVPLSPATAPQVLPNAPPSPVTAKQAATPLSPRASTSPATQAPTPPPLAATGMEFQIAGKTKAAPPAKEESRTPKATRSPAKAKGAFHIQIFANPDKEKAANIAKKLRGEKFVVQVETVAIKGKGQWHRVLVGAFEDRAAALRYLSAHQLDKAYPGSFIQKTGSK